MDGIKSREDYLETILVLTKKTDDSVRKTDIAESIIEKATGTPSSRVIINTANSNIVIVRSLLLPAAVPLSH